MTREGLIGLTNSSGGFAKRPGSRKKSLAPRAGSDTRMRGCIWQSARQHRLKASTNGVGDGLTKLDASAWKSELASSGDALNLMVRLAELGVAPTLGYQYQDALAEHAEPPSRRPDTPT